MPSIVASTSASEASPIRKKTPETPLHEASRIRKKNPDHIPVKVRWTEDMKPLKLLVPRNHRMSGLRRSLLGKAVPENVVEKLVIGDASVPLFDTGRASEPEKSMKEIDEEYGDASADGFLWFRLPASSPSSIDINEEAVAAQQQQPAEEVKGKEIENGQVDAVSPSSGKNATENAEEDFIMQLAEAKQAALAAEQKTHQAEFLRMELQLATEHLMDSNNEKEAEIKVLQAKLQELSSAYNLQTRDNEEQDVQIKDLKAQVQEMLSEFSLLMCGKDKNEAEIKEKDKEIEGLKAHWAKQWDEFQTRMEEKLAQIEHLKAQLSETSSQCDSLRNDTQEKDSVIEVLEMEMKEMSSHNKALLEEKEAEIAALQAIAARTEQECAKMSKEMQSCKEMSDACVKEVEDQAELVKILQTRFFAKQTHLTSVEEAKQKAEGELEGMRTQCSLLEEKLQKCKEDSTIAIMEAAKHQQAKEERHKQALRSVMEELTEAGCRAQKSERDLEAQRRANAELVAMLQETKKHNEEMKAELAAMAAAAAAAKEVPDFEDADGFVMVTGSSSH